MAIMKDSEGVEIPKYDDRALFDADLCCWGKDELPCLSVNIPSFFECDDEQHYSSEGLVTVSLKCVLEEYIESFVEDDGGVGIDTFANYLEDYAKRIREKLKES